MINIQHKIKIYFKWDLETAYNMLIIKCHKEIFQAHSKGQNIFRRNKTDISPYIKGKLWILLLMI